MISTIYESPIGTLTLVSNGKALTNLRLREHQIPGAGTPARRRRNPRQSRDVSSTRTSPASCTGFTVPVRPQGTEFQQQCWAALQKIPYGETRCYGEQAVAIGNPKAVRAVGFANGRNPIAVIIPCHRVIGADGSLTGFGGGMPTQESSC